MKRFGALSAIEPVILSNLAKPPTRQTNTTQHVNRTIGPENKSFPPTHAIFHFFPEKNPYTLPTKTFGESHEPLSHKTSWPSPPSQRSVATHTHAQKLKWKSPLLNASALSRRAQTQHTRYDYRIAHLFEHIRNFSTTPGTPPCRSNRAARPHTDTCTDNFVRRKFEGVSKKKRI